MRIFCHRRAQEDRSDDIGGVGREGQCLIRKLGGNRKGKWGGSRLTCCWLGRTVRGSKETSRATARRMPKTRRQHPGWKRGDRAEVTIPPAELLFQKETRMRYVGPNDSSCLDAMLSSSVTSIRRRKRGMLYLIIWPIAERMIFRNSLQDGRHAAADISFFVKGQILGREKKKKRKSKVRLNGDLSVYLQAPIHMRVS